jgi:glycerol kinase
MLPQIRSSSEVYGEAKGALAGISVAGDLGDQQAATFGQAAYDVGDAKNTYGTGCFMILNTGTDLVPSKSGLLTTVGWKLGDAPAIYALEGSIAITGALVQWLRDNLGLIEKSEDGGALRRRSRTAADLFVPAAPACVRAVPARRAPGACGEALPYVSKGPSPGRLSRRPWRTREVS